MVNQQRLPLAMIQFTNQSSFRSFLEIDCIVFDQALLSFFVSSIILISWYLQLNASFSTASLSFLISFLSLVKYLPSIFFFCCLLFLLLLLLFLRYSKIISHGVPSMISKSYACLCVCSCFFLTILYVERRVVSGVAPHAKESVGSNV